MVADLREIELVDASFSGGSPPTEFEITVRNNNPKIDNWGNYVTYRVSAYSESRTDFGDNDAIAGDTIQAIAGGEEASASISWSNSDLDSGDGVVVFIDSILLYDADTGGFNPNFYRGGLADEPGIPDGHQWPKKFEPTFDPNTVSVGCAGSLPDQLEVGDSFTVSAEVVNNNDVSAGAIVEFQVGGMTDQKAVNANANSTEQVSMEFTVESAGQVDVSVLKDDTAEGGFFGTL